MMKNNLWILLACALGMAYIAGCNKPATNTVPQQSAADKAKMEAESQKANLQFRRGQIERSNLSPTEKQRALSQLDASGGK